MKDCVGVLAKDGIISLYSCSVVVVFWGGEVLSCLY